MQIAASTGLKKMFDIKEIGTFELYLIQKHRVPYGLYYHQRINDFVAVDNTTGQAITEVFETKEMMMEWFEHKSEIEDIEAWKQKMMLKK